MFIYSISRLSRTVYGVSLLITLHLNLHVQKPNSYVLFFVAMVRASLGHYQAKSPSFLKRKKKSMTIILLDDELTLDNDKEKDDKSILGCTV